MNQEAYKPWIRLGVATVVSAIAAFGLNVVLGQVLAVDAPAEAPATAAPVLADAAASPPSPGQEQALTLDGYLTSILGRNMFDHTKITTDIGSTDDAAPSDGSKLTELNVRLTGTVVVIPADRSAAFIAEDKAAGSPRPYGIGQSVQGAEIVAIYERKVKLKRNNAFEWLLLDDEEPPPASTSSEEPSDGEEVVQTDDNNFVVDRSLIDEALSDLDGLSKMGRALLHRGPDGQFDGYRLSAIRRGTLADKLGIRNGDIIHSVNGMPLTSVQGAMTALQSLQSESNLKFEVTRRGQPVDLAYEIQ